MILYLCSNQNINLFDFLDIECGMPIKKMAGVFNLKKFVINDVKNLSQFRYLIIDLKALKNTETEVIEAIAAFETMYSARIIVFAEGLDANSSLLSQLIEMGIYNLITSMEFEDIKEEIFDCISDSGKDRRSAIRSKYFSQEEISDKEKNQYTFLCRDIKIAVVGAAHKVGTTTTAFNLLSFLVNVGADAAYVEANTHEHLKYLPNYYKDMSTNETYIEYKGAKYFFRGHFPGESNFTIIDFGTLDQCRVQALKQCEILILCGTTKPYEIDDVKVALQELDGLPVSVLLSCTPIKEQRGIEQLLGHTTGAIYYTEYSPDIFDGKTNAAIYEGIVKEYMQEQQNQ